MRNSIYKELNEIMTSYYIFLPGEKAKWEALQEKYSHLSFEPEGENLYSKLQDMLREMNDPHLAIHFQNIIDKIPDILFTLIDTDYYIANGGKYEKVQSINQTSIVEILRTYQNKYPYLSEGSIQQMLLEDFYCNRFYSYDGMCINAASASYSVSLVDKKAFLSKYSAVSKVRSPDVQIPKDIIYVPLVSYKNTKIPDLTNCSNPVVIDIRNNVGGYVKRALELAAQFVHGNVTINDYSVVSQNGTENFMIKGRLASGIKTNAIILLANEHTMSSAEYVLLLGLIRSLNAITLGRPTFGASGQGKLFMINNKIPLTVTTKKYVDENLQILRHGITPQFNIQNKVDDSYMTKDNQLNSALHMISKM